MAARNMARAPLDVPNSTVAVAEALSRPSHCVPHGGVMLSMANPHHKPLRTYQFAKIQHVKCLMDRLVSVCWGFEDDGYGKCVYGKCITTSKGTPSAASACVPSDYRRSQYVSLNWAKWPFFIDALRVARVILWIEADVVINRNPWEGLAGVPDVDAPWLVRPGALPPMDVTYQWESPPCNGTSAAQWEGGATWVRDPGSLCRRTTAPHPEPLNCGQLLITSLSFARAVWDSRPMEFINSHLSQQHYANVVKLNYRHDGLPLDYFNNCWLRGKAVVMYQTCRAVTFHATCSTSEGTKAVLMKRFVEKFRECPLNNRTGRLLRDWTT